MPELGKRDIHGNSQGPYGNRMGRVVHAIFSSVVNTRYSLFFCFFLSLFLFLPIIIELNPFSVHLYVLPLSLSSLKGMGYVYT